LPARRSNALLRTSSTASSGLVRDPDGHRRLIGHAIETVTPQETQRRYVALLDIGR